MLKCEKCGEPTFTLKYLNEKSGWCPPCFYADSIHHGQSAMIATDDIPGGLAIQHGLCHEDGTPRKFYSKSDIKRAAFEAGWTIGGETPKPNQRLREARLAKEEAKSHLD